ncbi:MAG: energy transducer TonB [Proteobacteria bacterium]|nr:energy transducer TonB [Pseudomonadota bacterium]
MPTYPPQRRLYFALTASVLLHAALLGVNDLARSFSLRPSSAAVTVLQARLLPAPNETALLKNTLSEGEGQPLPPPQPLVAPAAKAMQVPLRQRLAERKLAEHLFYPPEAIARGLEGEVRLLLTLAPDGKVLDAQIVSSSGHRLLDQAAAEAAYAMRRLPNTGVRELILPVVFRLQ